LGVAVGTEEEKIVSHSEIIEYNKCMVVAETIEIEKGTSLGCRFCERGEDGGAYCRWRARGMGVDAPYEARWEGYPIANVTSFISPLDSRLVQCHAENLMDRKACVSGLE